MTDLSTVAEASAAVGALRGRQLDVARLIDEARATLAEHDAAPSGPGQQETWDREILRARALDYLRRICAVDAGHPDPGAS